MRIRIATRASKLAMWQANNLASWITENIERGVPELVPVMTSGDQIQDRPLHEVEGKTLFIKEVEHILLAGQADVAVHCTKDYHPQTPEDFLIAAFPESESDRDVLISRKPLSCLAELAPGALVGTTSQRRIFFLRKARPDLKFAMLRGNIDSRLARLASDEFDAIVLAEAGLNRLGLRPENTLVLTDETMLPAVGQGALIVEVCRAQTHLAAQFSSLNHEPTRLRVIAERAFVSGLSADCKSAVGVSCRITEDGNLILKGHVGHPKSLEEISGEVSGRSYQSEEIGKRLAKQFLERGAARLLKV